jgi:hypothetical protein
MASEILESATIKRRATSKALEVRSTKGQRKYIIIKQSAVCALGKEERHLSVVVSIIVKYSFGSIEQKGRGAFMENLRAAYVTPKKA